MSESKKNKAVALRYSMEEDAAPIVIASGYGHIADKIIDIAENQGIPVFRDLASLPVIGGKRLKIDGSWQRNSSIKYLFPNLLALLQ